MLSYCRLCPRECMVDRSNGEVGFCGLDDKIKIARADLHFWEEPCISGKNGSGTVFFSGCNLKCVYCQNYNISTLNKGYNVDKHELADLFLMLQNKKAHNINLVTPTHFVPQIIDSLDIARENGLKIPVVYNSSGYEKVETLKMLKGYIDIYIPDMKYFSSKYALEYSLAEDYYNICKRAINEMVNQVGSPSFDEKGIMTKGVIVRHMMLPGLLFDSKKIIDYLFDTYKDDIYISIMSQYTPMKNVCKVERLNRKLSKKHYETMIEYCYQKGMVNAFIQGDDSSDESFIPEFIYER